MLNTLVGRSPRWRGFGLVAVLLLYAPFFIAWRRDEDLTTYGFCLAPVRRGLALPDG